MKLEIKIGQKFSHLTVVKELDRKRLPSGQTNRVFLMRCVCGKEKEIRLLHFERLSGINSIIPNFFPRETDTPKIGQLA